MKNLAKHHTDYSLIISFIYLILGLGWISLSDTFLFHFSLSVEKVEFFSKSKGYFYVFVNTLLIYFIIRASTNSISSVKNDFKRLFDENPNPMWIYECSTLKILLVNNAACKAYQYTKQEFLTLNLYSISAEKEHNKLLHYTANPKIGYSSSGEWLHRDRLGRLFHVNIFSHDTLYDKKKCRTVSAINVHKEKLAEIERKNIKKALDNSAIVSITDLKGNILEANSRFCKVSKYDENELIGQNHSIINSGYHSKEFWAEMWQAINQGDSWRADVKNKAKDGSFYWVDTVISPVFDSEGKIYECMSIRYEITERKKLEEKLLLQNNRLSEIAWHQSHGVRRPVSTILGLCNLMKQDVNATETEKQQYIDYLYKATEELDEVIHKIVAKTYEIE